MLPKVPMLSGARAALDNTQRLRSEIEGIIARYSSASVSSRHETPVPGLHVARIVAPIPPTTHMAEASVCLCIRGSRKLTVGEGVYAQNENEYLLSTVGLPAIVAIPDASLVNPYTALRIEIDLDLARQVMADIDVEGIRPSQAEACLSFGQLDPPFMDAVARLVRLIEAPNDVAFMSGLLHREILYRLLSGPGGQRLRQIIRRDSQDHRVAKAAAWLRSHFRDKLKIEQLATVAGMGVSTLHRHFQELTGMSPLQYQKQLRLHEARRQMLNDDVDVGTTALNVGYESSTQFIREYRRLFGQPPLRHANALRAGGGDRDIL